MDELINKYGLADAAAMLVAAFRIRRIPADVAAWLYDRNVVLAARRRRRRRWASTSCDDWGCLVAAGAGTVPSPLGPAALEKTKGIITT